MQLCVLVLSFELGVWRTLVLAAFINVQRSLFGAFSCVRLLLIVHTTFICDAFS